MQRTICLLATLGLAAAANAQTLRITPDEPLTIRFRCPADATPTPDMFNVLFGITEAGGTGLRVAELFDEGTLLGTHSQALFGGVVGGLSLNPGITFRTASSPYTFFDAGVIDMSTLIDGTEDGVVIWTIASGFLEFDTANLRFDWGQGLSPSSYRGANPDCTVIEVFVGNPCRADFDGDGELTIFDFLAFQNAFDSGDLAADFDGDGDLTIFDFLEFQNEFDAGCD
ncbi:MAG: GC-type dockerin domain-anchored protein [Planctomycetota bacterium]